MEERAGDSQVTRRIDISISAKVYLPDDVPVADYLRAVANHLADVLPHQDARDDLGAHVSSTSKTWRAGREVGITVETCVANEVLPPIPNPDPTHEEFADASFGELAPQGLLL